jgi:hypothetical protein
MQIDDLYEDLSDGIRLIALLQIICREKVCKVRRRSCGWEGPSFPLLMVFLLVVAR